MLQNTPICTIDRKSGEYAPIPLNIVCAVIHYLLFLYKKMNIFIIFFVRILAKYSPKRTKLHHFKKSFSGEHAPKPPSKRVALPRAAWRYAPCKYPHFYRNILTPPPPPPPTAMKEQIYTYIWTVIAIIVITSKIDFNCNV